MNTLQCEAMDNPVIKVADIEAPARCVVFDKDGTLIDFHAIWGPRLARGAMALAEATDLGDEFLAHLYRAAGYDPDNGMTSGQGPLATAPLQFDNAVSDKGVKSVEYMEGHYLYLQVASRR